MVGVDIAIGVGVSPGWGLFGGLLLKDVIDLWELVILWVELWGLEYFSVGIDLWATGCVL